MRRTLMLLLSCLAIQVMSVAEPARDKDVVITISVDRDVILPCEPLGVAVVLKNKSGNVIEKTGSQWTSFRIKKEGEGENWNSYMGCGLHVLLGPPRKLKLLSGQSFEDICLIHVNSNDEPVFKNPGVYYVQSGTPFGESEAIRIMVKIPELSADIVEPMYNKKLFMLFDEYTAEYFLGKSRNIDNISKDLNDFRESLGSAPYLSWIIFGEFILKKTKIDHQEALKKNDSFDRLIEEYESVAEKLPSPQKENLILAMASIQIDQGRKSEALDILRKIISTHTDGYFKIKAISRLMHIRNLQ
ncbi:MAG: hypothetical protein GX574_06955 [Lentisphaerae bacterium]|nr:hypothetical protein [Lentisphaerota bacterium]